tara:strand:- start:129 stop:1013 length:885 start_codon:yes stop_codon:yes gene_type:complete
LYEGHDVGLWLWKPDSLPDLAGNIKPWVSAYTDSSDFAWGFVCDRERRSGDWSALDSKQHINWKELRTVLIMLLDRGKSWRGRRVVLYIDNKTALSYVNKGYGRIPHLSALAFEIKSLCLEFQIDLIAVYIPSRYNVLADGLSRHKLVDHTDEWRVAPFALSRMEGALQSTFDRVDHGMVPLQDDTHYLFVPPWDRIGQTFESFFGSINKFPSVQATFVVPLLPGEQWWRFVKRCDRVCRFSARDHVYDQPMLDGWSPVDYLKVPIVVVSYVPQAVATISVPASSELMTMEMMR